MNKTERVNNLFAALTQGKEYKENIIYRKEQQDPTFHRDESSDEQVHLALELLHRVSNLAYEEQEAEKLMSRALEMIIEGLEGGRGCIIFERDGIPGAEFNFVFRSRVGETANFSRREFLISRSVARTALERGVGTVSANTLSDDRFPESSSVRKLNIHSIVCVPLEGQKEIVGAIYIDSIWKSKRFHRVDLDLLTAIGRQLGLGIERAQAVNELQKNKSKLEEIVEERTKELLASREQALHASRAKSIFLANISHELRTPLNAIIGYSELLIEEAEEVNAIATDVILHDLQKIRKSGNHLLSLINNILDISKIESGKMELFVEEFAIADLVESVKDTIFPAMEKNENVFRVNYDKNIGNMYSDLTKIKQCILNLLGNAAKFTSRGTVTLEIKKIREQEKEWMLFVVKDTGIGISQENIKKLFQVFSQVGSSDKGKHQGSGLGLVISQKICNLMGGSIDVQSKPYQGSTFVIKVPCHLAMDTQEQEA